MIFGILEVQANLGRMTGTTSSRSTSPSRCPCTGGQSTPKPARGRPGGPNARNPRHCWRQMWGCSSPRGPAHYVFLYIYIYAHILILVCYDIPCSSITVLSGGYARCANIHYMGPGTIFTKGSATNRVSKAKAQRTSPSIQQNPCLSVQTQIEGIWGFCTLAGSRNSDFHMRKSDYRLVYTPPLWARLQAPLGKTWNLNPRWVGSSIDPWFKMFVEVSKTQGP